MGIDVMISGITAGHGTAEAALCPQTIYSSKQLLDALKWRNVAAELFSNQLFVLRGIDQ